MDIKAIVFDFGGVIQYIKGGKILEDIARIINVPYDEFKIEYFKFNHLSNIHNLLWEEMILEVIKVFTDSPELKRQVLDRARQFHSNKELNSELIAFIPLLKENGYKIGILSNYTSSLRSELSELKIDHLFDEIVISSEVGYQKPQKEIFEILFKKLRVLPQELIFIDDAPKSLEGADQIGYHPILFENNLRLEKDLANLGVFIQRHSRMTPQSQQILSESNSCVDDRPE